MNLIESLGEGLAKGAGVAAVVVTTHAGAYVAGHHRASTAVPDQVGDTAVVDALMPFYPVRGLDDAQVAGLLWELKGEEGYVGKVYHDQVGVATVGIGHNLEAHPLPLPVSLHLALYDVQGDCNRFADDWQPYIEQEGHIRVGLCDAAFQLGPAGLEGFHNTLQALAEGRCEDAEQGIASSRWHQQTANRADHLEQLFERYCG